MKKFSILNYVKFGLRDLQYDVIIIVPRPVIKLVYIIIIAIANSYSIKLTPLCQDALCVMFSVL